MQRNTNLEFIPISKPSISSKEVEYVSNAVKSGWVSSLGEYIELFEKKFSEFCNTEYALTVSNGTTALHLALLSSGIEVGDEVIIPDLTFVATANAVKYCGAIPIFADIEEDTLCINPDSVKRLITPRTKAIIPVHLYGHPANMPIINKLGDEYNLIVIEDAAEAHGATINNVPVGSWGKCGVFSFYGNKIITSGEGGMITTNSGELYERAKKLRDHAMSKEKRYWHDMIGYNYRMTNLQAALGCAQLERIDNFIARRKEVIKLYRNRLSRLNSRIKLNYQANWAESVYWMVCLEVFGFDEIERNKFMTKLKDLGIDSRPYFYPLSDMPMYSHGNTEIAHLVSKRGINLPSYYQISDFEIEYICDNIIAILNE